MNTKRQTERLRRAFPARWAVCTQRTLSPRSFAGMYHDFNLTLYDNER